MLKAQILGNLGSDPELKFSAQGSGILRFSVAANYRAKGESGEWEERTQWVRVSVFGRRGEVLAEHLKKGAKVYCDGRLEARPWSRQDGSPEAGLELIADTVEFMSSRQEGEVRATRGSVTTLGERRDEPADLESLPW